MGQVPAEKSDGECLYLLIGDGKLASHLAYYLSTLGLNVRQWSRRASQPALETLARKSTHALIAISDGAIEEVARTLSAAAPNARRVHFSGSLVTPLAFGAHPLMSFPTGHFAADAYPRIPFVLERGGPSFQDLLPGLPNPHFAINPADKPLYHALCVLSGNFTVLLWQKFFAELEERFGIPRATSREYLRAVARNLEREDFPLTGPLARGDHATIARNVAALDGDPFQAVYLSFVQAFRAASPQGGIHEQRP